MRNKSNIDSWIVCFQSNPHASLRLFCFPCAGGSSFIFRTWSDYLPSNVEVCAIELPGRGRQIKLAPFNRLEPLVKAIASSIQPYLDRPFCLFGHSMGGLISFELARLLRQKYGILPQCLFVSGHRAPQIPDPDPPIHNLPEAALLEQLRHLNGTPAAVLENAELMQLFLPILRADFAVLETYVYTPQAPLECAIATFGGLEDSRVSYQQLQAWQQHTKTSFSLHVFPGDHFFLHSAQPILLQCLAQYFL